jgi:hypothetical protein
LNITDEQLDDLGKLADTADNYAAAAKLRLPDSLHREALTKGMEIISEALKNLYKQISGENPWD